MIFATQCGVLKEINELIIKSHSIRTGTAERVTSYVLAAGQNEAVETLEGAAEALLDADAYATSTGHRSSLIHITISPDQEISETDLSLTINAINAEFGFDQRDPCLLVRHQMKRSNGLLLSHYHLLRPAADGNGRVYPTFRSKKKDETVSRYVEIKLGHRITPGKHNDFVFDRYTERGMLNYAAQISDILNCRPKAAFNAGQQRKLERQGFDIARLTEELKEITRLEASERAKAFAALLVEHGNLSVTRGVKSSRLLIKKDGRILLNANRSLNIHKSDMTNFIEKVQEEIQSETAQSKNRKFASDRRFISRFARDIDPEPTSDHRRQPDHKVQYGSDCKPVRGTEKYLGLQHLHIATMNVSPMIDALQNRAESCREISLEPLIDLNDPFLMMKLSRALARSLGSEYHF